MMNIRTLLAASAVALMALAPRLASAQTKVLADGPIVYGHYHLYIPNVDAQKKFWVEGLGGMPPAKLGPLPIDVVKFPNVIIFLSARQSAAPVQTPIHHIALQVANLRSAVDRVKAAGYPLVTRATLPAGAKVDAQEIGTAADEELTVAFVRGPDDVLVELVENKSLSSPVALHHVHLQAPDVAAAQAWYGKVFGTKAGKRGKLLSADLPGVSLVFSPATQTLAPSKGQVIDHIGLEIRGLEAFTKELTTKSIPLDRQYMKVAAANLGVAFVNDPNGTSIELNENQDQ